MNEEARSTSGVDLPAKLPRRGRTWLRWLALVMLLAGGAALWAGWSPRLPRGPVHLVRDPQGQLMPATDQDSDDSGLHWEAQAGAIQAQNNLSSSSTSARSRRARFACRRLAIVCRSPHELMQRVGPCLLEHLKKLRGFEHVDYYPVGKTPGPGALSPDGIVEIEMDSIGESGLMPVRTLEATIRVTASCGLMRSSNYYSGPLDPPCVDWNFEAALEHHSTTTGVGTPSSRYKLAAQNIGQQLGEALVKYLNEMHDKDGPLPLLPDAFYPPYKPPPELPRPPEVTAELRASSHGLMNARDPVAAGYAAGYGGRADGVAEAVDRRRLDDEFEGTPAGRRAVLAHGTGIGCHHGLLRATPTHAADRHNQRGDSPGCVRAGAESQAPVCPPYRRDELRADRGCPGRIIRLRRLCGVTPVFRARAERSAA